MMNGLVACHEFKHGWREKLLPTLLVITLLLTGFSFYNGYQWSKQQQAVIAAAQLEQQQAIAQAQQALVKRRATTPINWWDDVTDLRGYAFYLMVNYALKPPQAMAPVAVGQSDVLPYFFRLTVGKKQDFIHQHETVHPLLLQLGKFDLAFFTVYLLPLLIIVACYSALSQEKHSGQLLSLMVQGLSPLRLLLIQLTVRAGVIVIPLIAGSLLLLIIFQPEASALALLGLGGLLLLYALFWLALCALVISFGKTASYNISTLIACWLAWVIIIPALGNSWMQWMHPVPSRIHYVDTLRQVTDQVEQSTANTLANFFQDHPELASNNAAKPLDHYSVKKLASINAIEKTMQPVQQAFEQHLIQQQRSAAQWQLLSPASITQSALSQLAGNGLEGHQHFMAQTQQYHAQLRGYFQTRIIAAVGRGDFAPCEGCNANITLTEFSAIPVFSYRSYAPSIQWLPIGCLATMVLIMAYVALIRVGGLGRAQ